MRFFQLAASNNRIKQKKNKFMIQNIHSLYFIYFFSVDITNATFFSDFLFELLNPSGWMDTFYVLFVLAMLMLQLMSVILPSVCFHPF